MKNQNIFWIILLIVLIVLPSQSFAGILTTISISDENTALHATDWLDVTFDLRDTDGTEPFESGEIRWQITMDDIGRTLFEDESTSLVDRIEDLKTLLTNGIDDSFHMHDNIAKGTDGQFPGYQYESAVLNNESAVDWQGYNIDNISLTVNDLGFEIESETIFTQYSYDVTFTIYGSPVPEPCTVLLFGFGGLVLRKWRRR